MRNEFIAVGAIALLSMAACGGRSRTSTDGPSLPTVGSAPPPSTDTGLAPPTDPATVESTADFFFAGRSDGNLYVLQVDVAKRTVAPFGPALSNVLANSEIIETWIDPAAKRAIIEVGPPRGDGQFFAGDGASWWPLSTIDLPTYVAAPIVSDDLSLVWSFDAQDFGHSAGDSTVMSFDGKVVLKLHASDIANPPQVVAFAPDSSWLAMLRDDGLIARTSSGVETVVNAHPERTFSRGGVTLTRPTSMIMVREPYPELAWVDLAGKDLSVPGFVPDRTLSIRNYQLNPGALVPYGDRQFGTDVIPLAPDLTPIDVPAARKGVGAIIQRDVLIQDGQEALVAVDENGAIVDRYAPTPSASPQAMGSMTAASINAAMIDAGIRLVVLDVSHFIFEGDVGRTVDRSLDAWATTGPGPGRVVRLRSNVPSDARWQVQIAKSGRAFAWVEDGSLHTVDAATLVETSLPSSYVLSAAHVNVRH